jgi:hypothetical protein
MKILPVPEPRRGKRDAVATKAAIVAAALEEFAQLGLAGARIDEIARAARVTLTLTRPSGPDALERVSQGKP